MRLSLLLFLSLMGRGEAQEQLPRVLAISLRQVEAPEAVQSLWSVREALKARSDLRSISQAEQLSFRNSRTPYEELARGLQALHEGRHMDSIQALDQAAAWFETHGEMRSTIRALKGLAQVALQRQDQRGGVEILRRLQGLGLEISTQDFSPQMMAWWREAQESVARGGLYIETYPTPAAIFIKGRFMGSSPLRLKNLRAGSLSFRLEADTYLPEIRTLFVQPGGEERLEIPMRRAPKAILLELIRESLPEEMQRRHPGSALRDLKALFAVEQVILLDIRRASIKASLFDLRSARRLRVVERQGVDLGPSIVEALYRPLSAEERASKHSLNQDEKEDTTQPFYRTWWFGAGVGLGTALLLGSLLFWPEDPAFERDGRGSLILQY